VYCTFSTRIYTKQQYTVHLPHVYTQNSSALYIFHKFIHKTAVYCTFSTRLYTKQQCTLHLPHVYTQNSSVLYICHTFIHKTAVHCTFSTRLYTKQQCTVHFPHVYTQNSSALYIFDTFIHKTAVHCTFSTRLYTKPQHSVNIFRPRRKEAQTRSTIAPDRKDGPEFGFQNATSLPECLSQCVNEKLGCLGQFKILCQMHAAQLFTAPCSTNAQQASCRLCGNNYKINDI